MCVRVENIVDNAKITFIEIFYLGNFLQTLIFSHSGLKQENSAINNGSKDKINGVFLISSLRRPLWGQIAKKVDFSF